MAKAKSKTAFVCNECGSEYSKWMGRCNDCGAWNSVVEFRLGSATSKRSKAAGGARAGFAGALVETQVLAERASIWARRGPSSTRREQTERARYPTGAD